MGTCEFQTKPTPTTLPASKFCCLLLKNIGISKANFQFHYVVGRGGYGKVWKVHNKKDTKDYALKEMTKALIIAKKSVVSIVFERELLSRVTNP